MAVTGIRPIRAGVGRLVDYVVNPAKTDGYRLVTGIGCEPLTAECAFAATAATAARLRGGRGGMAAYHAYQSFAPGDGLTADQAHGIGVELAARLLGGRHECVVATHVDRGHIHNHLVFNAVSTADLRRFRSVPGKTVRMLRNTSDGICRERGVSVLPSDAPARPSRGEARARDGNRSWKSEIRKVLDLALEGSTGYAGFKAGASAMGVDVDDSGKHIKYRMARDGQQRWTRGKTIDAGGRYTADGVRERTLANGAVAAAAREAVAAASGRARNARELALLVGRSHGLSVERLPGGGALVTAGGVSVSSAAVWGDGPGPDAAAGFETGLGPAPKPEGDRFRITADDVAKATADGLLLRAGGRTVHIPASGVDGGRRGGDSWAVLDRDGAYAVVPERPDPDVLESRQATGETLTGEEVARALDLAHGTEPERVFVAYGDIRASTAASVVVELPGDGIRALAVDRSMAARDPGRGGYVVDIYPGWAYGFRAVGGGGDGRIGGAELAALLARPAGPADAAARARRARNDAREAARAGRPLSGPEDAMEARMAGLRAEAEDARARLAEGRELLGLLLARERGLPIREKLDGKSAPAAARYAALHKAELEGYARASDRLSGMGVDAAAADAGAVAAGLAALERALRDATREIDRIGAGLAAARARENAGRGPAERLVDERKERG